MSTAATLDPATTHRLTRLREKLEPTGADALLVTRPANVRYLSSFTSPADARVLLTSEGALLLTDGRYTFQAQQESSLEADISASSAGWLERVAELAKGQALAVESDHLTLSQYEELGKTLKLVPSTGLVAELRLVKTEDELGHLRRAAAIADDAFSHILNVITPGLSELEVALELEAFMRRAGAEAKAFDITVASGARSSMPHGTASPKLMRSGELVTLDFGARVAGYHSDLTRTVALGEVPDRERHMYEAVLEAQQTALSALAPGADGRALDTLARDVLERHGLAQYFAHSLGHGVGLEVHEAPALSFRQSAVLAPGMCVTVEPGVYIPGVSGVRIEDLAVVSEDGFALLSHASKAFIQL